MPEGHTILRAARLWSTIAGTPLEISSPQGRFELEAKQVNGKELLNAYAHGKHLFLRFPDDQIIHIHLALYGKHHWRPAPIEPPRLTVRLRAVHPTGAIDLIGPHVCELITQIEADAIIASLGPDPLQQETLSKEFLTSAAKVTTPIGRFFMEQSKIAGIGNVYRAEILFVCGISPYTPVSDISKSQWERIWKVARELMIPGVDLEGPTETILPGSPTPVTLTKPLKLDPGRTFYVYQCTGQQCLACGNAVEEEQFYGRTLYLCRTCQTR